MHQERPKEIPKHCVVKLSLTKQGQLVSVEEFSQEVPYAAEEYSEQKFEFNQKGEFVLFDVEIRD